MKACEKKCKTSLELRFMSIALILMKIRIDKVELFFCFFFFHKKNYIFINIKLRVDSRATYVDLDYVNNILKGESQRNH